MIRAVFQWMENVSQFTYMVYMGHFILNPLLFFLSSHYFRVRLRELAQELFSIVSTRLCPNKHHQVNQVKLVAEVSNVNSLDKVNKVSFHTKIPSQRKKQQSKVGAISKAQKA